MMNANTTALVAVFEQLINYFVHQTNPTFPKHPKAKCEFSTDGAPDPLSTQLWAFSAHFWGFWIKKNALLLTRLWLLGIVPGG